jgi:hypothetical protein
MEEGRILSDTPLGWEGLEEQLALRRDDGVDLLEGNDDSANHSVVILLSENDAPDEIQLATLLRRV